MLKAKFSLAFLSSEYHRWIGILCLTCVLSACSTTSNKATKTTQNAPTKGPYEQVEGESIPPSVVEYQDDEDPLRFINEPIFEFNDVLYRYLLTPMGKGYNAVVPAPVDESLGNLFSNIREPLYSVNHLFQGEVAKSGKSLLRLVINSTVGILGLFDPAEAWWDIKEEKVTFGDTLASYGVGHGAYLVLPILGPSDFRDGSSLTFEYFTHPLNHINDEDAAQHLLLFEGFRNQVPTLTNYPKILQETDKPYEFMRKLYLQKIQRDAQALRGEEFKTVKEKEKEQQ